MFFVVFLPAGFVLAVGEVYHEVGLVFVVHEIYFLVGIILMLGKIPYALVFVGFCIVRMLCLIHNEVSFIFAVGYEDIHVGLILIVGGINFLCQELKEVPMKAVAKAIGSKKFLILIM